MNQEIGRDDTRVGLEKLRTRLLDLTNRNKLLNFRHTKKSCLRVVDELPDELFGRLIEGEKLVFRPVPEPKRDDYVVESSETRTAEERDNPESDNEEGASPGLLRRRKPTAREYAEKLGYAVSFDLPLPNVGPSVSPHHQDKYVQTLHYPPELESILRRVNSAASTAIEETGTNMLYLVFGFLQWYEADETDQEHYAPLLMLPARLTRGKPNAQTGRFEYTVEYSGEDLTPNLSLLEKLKRDYSLVLPELAPEDAPEGYFKKFSNLLEYNPRWQIRRKITLALLNFGKLLMFRDLDPKNWPKTLPLHQHPKVKDFFEGTRRDYTAHSEEYCIDAPELRGEVPNLIYDADSSQHSALIDALKGKDLVIEGPPGTGKSQTITNLIAAALAKRKTVLFISEKLAALEVVRRRLDEAGLGVFCLELHSHKTQKKEFLNDLQRRLKAKGTFKDPRDLDDKFKLIEKNKEQLIAYANLINSEYGAMRKSVFDIMWTRERFRQELPFDAAHVETLFLEGTHKYSLADFEVGHQIIEIHIQHLTAVLAQCAQVEEHPWHGVTNANLDYLGERELFKKLERKRGAADSLRTLVTDFTAKAGRSADPTINLLQRIVKARQSLPHLSGSEIPALLPALLHVINRQILCEFTLQLSSLQARKASFNKVLPRLTRIETEAIHEARQAYEWFIKRSLESYTFQQLEELSRKCELLQDLIKVTGRFVEQLLSYLSCQIPFNDHSLRLLIQAIKVLRFAPFEVLPLRHQGLQTESASINFHSARRDAQSLIKGRSRFGQDFFLNISISSEELYHHATNLASASLLDRLFGTEYRSARRLYRRISRRKERLTRQDMAVDLQDLGLLFEKQKQFEDDPRYQALFGPHFRGLKTPIEEFGKILSWYEEVRTNLLVTDKIGHVLSESLFNCPNDYLKSLYHFVTQNEESVRNLEELGTICSEIYGDFTEELRQAVSASLHEAAERLAGFSRELKRQLQSLSAIGMAKETHLSSIPQLIADLSAVIELQHSIENNMEAQRLLGRYYAGVDSDLIQLQVTLELADSLTSNEPLQSFQEWLLCSEIASRLDELAIWIERAETLLTDYLTLGSEIEELCGLKAGLWYQTVMKDLKNLSLDMVINRADRALSDPAGLSCWLDYLRSSESVKEVKLDKLASIAESGQIQPAHLLPAYRFVVFNSLTRSILQEHPALLKFSGYTHEQVQKKFREYDQEAMELYRQRVAHLIDLRQVPEGVSTGPISYWTNLALIQNEINKQKRHIPIRQLVNRSGAALQALKPCFMMGPLSVAQYLEPGRLTFDLVVMDEASQLRPEDAIGAIARGSQVVIVGDPKQLPPTSFFERMFGETDGVEEEDDTLAVEESESILDIAASLYQPVRRLRWHYRSRHGSLIAFSNREFYGGNLVVFPSPVEASPLLGVKYEYVPNGEYENRVNRVEAEHVVEAALEHMTNHRTESLGIVTSNSDQRDLIEGLFEQRLKDDPFAQSFLDDRLKGSERFFIKNLENVQGDERDAIFISVTYGRDTQRNLYQRFGPINGINGHRRLNVLFTRAKHRTVVFTSMEPEELHVEPSSAWGLRALKGYLAYAKSGILEQPRESRGEAANDFEIAVGNELKSHGFDVVPQVGVAGFFIDLAIRHPQKAGSFILGIECDGAAYHSGRSARDRDRLRQEILVNLGWNIHRIWSTDWFKNRRGEIQKVLDRIKYIVSTEEIQAATFLRAGPERARAPASETAPRALATVAASTELAATRPSGQLSQDEARKLLIDLRENVMKQEMPAVDPRGGLLRKTMLETLLLHHPTSRQEWMERVPEVLRRETDERHLVYLDRVFEILAQLSE